MMSRMDASTRLLVVVAVAILGLVAAAVVWTQFLPTDRAPAHPADTPEGAVERYLLAVSERDVDGALAHLVFDEGEAVAACLEREVRSDVRHAADRLGDARVRLAEVEEDEPGRAVVTLDITYTRRPDLFELPREGHSTEEHVELQRREDGTWLIEWSDWPLSLDYLHDHCVDE